MPSEKENYKYCRISLFANDQDEKDSLHTTKTISHPTNFRIVGFRASEKNESFEVYQARVVQLIRQHVEKYGTTKEIRLVGHGSRGWIFSRKENTSNERISTGLFLDALIQVEANLKIKVADRIVFDACQTFAHMEENEIRYYSEYAKNHHVEIVGTTSNTETIVAMGLYIRAGRYVQFSPNGKIIWDKLDAPFTASMMEIDSDKSWTDFFVGHTLEEGIILKKAYEHENTSRKKNPENRERTR